MRPPLRDQGNYEGSVNDPMFACGTACTPEEDRCRQEFKNEADTSWLLRKYGALPPVRTFPQGEVDFDLTLLDAKMARAEALEAYQAFPRVLREQLSFDGFLAAVADGSFRATPIVKDESAAPDSPAK